MLNSKPPRLYRFNIKKFYVKVFKLRENQSSLSLTISEFYFTSFKNIPDLQNWDGTLSRLALCLRGKRKPTAVKTVALLIAYV